MSLKDVTESLFLSITINILIATAIGYFANPLVIIDLQGFAETISEYYGFSIVFLLIIYIIVQVSKNKLSLNKLSSVHKYLLMNICFTATLLFFTMTPTFLTNDLLIFLISTCVVANIMIPFILIFDILFNINEKKIELWNKKCERFIKRFIKK